MNNDTKNKNKYLIGGSIFWILIIFVSLLGLSYLGIWSYQNDSVKGAIISFIFFAMIICGVVLSKFEIFNIGTWGENCLVFTLGFSIWMGIGTILGTQSVLSVAKNQYFATIASELPESINFLCNVFVIPTSEELFWMIAIPFTLITLMFLIGRKYKIFNNGIFQIFIIILVSGLSFAFFHVGKQIISFLVSAFFFRSILIVVVYGDQKYDFIKKLNLLVSFALGAHIGNNWIDYGFIKGNLILMDNFWSVGWFIYILLIIMFISGFNTLMEIIFRKSIEASANDANNNG